MSEWEQLSKAELIDRIKEIESRQAGSVGPEESQRMQEELRIHQIELEMQNRELQETQAVLEETRDRYAGLYDHAPVGYVTLNADGMIEEINFAAAAMLGLERGRLTGKAFVSWVLAGDVPIFRGHLRRLFESGEKTIDELALEGKNDACYDVRLESIVTHDPDGGAHCQTAILDVSEQKRAEAKTRQQQAELAHVARLTTMGELASSIAHELNQPLGAITLYCQATLRMLDGGNFDRERLARALEQSAAQAQRAGDIIRRLREFIRKGRSSKEALDLNAVVHEAVQFVRAEVAENRIELRLDLEDDLPPVEVDRIQIEQVILNLMRNGIEAMVGAHVDRGRLLVQTRRAERRALRVSVQDTGPGLDPQAAEAVLNPFYTTKSGGMGMGLSISRSIVEAHGGRLWAEPQSGGALFHFNLPLAKNAEREPARTSH